MTDKIEFDYDNALMAGGNPVDEAQKAFTKLDNFKAFMEDGLKADSPNKLLFILNNSDNFLQSGLDAPNVSAEDFTETRLGEIAEKLDFTNKPVISTDPSTPYKITIEQTGAPDLTIANHKIGGNLKLMSFFTSEDGSAKVSGVVAVGAIGLVGAAVAKMADDAGIDTPAEIIEFLENSNLSALLDQINVAEIVGDVVTEAAIQGFISLIGGPVAVARNVYELVQNWGTLRGAVEFASEVYGDGTLVSNLDTALDQVELQLTSIFGADFMFRSEDELDISILEQQLLLDIIEGQTGVSNFPSSVQEFQEQADIAVENLYNDYCFPAGTKISLADGSTKAIEAIEIGDLVLAPDGLGELVVKPVTKTFSNTTNHFVHVQFSDARKDLYVTDGHRFLTETGDYVEIGHIMRLGGGKLRLVDQSGEVVEATATRVLYSTETEALFDKSSVKSVMHYGNTVYKEYVEEGWATYNFEVADLHAYVAGGVRVHNDSILGVLKVGDQLIALNDEMTDAAVIRGNSVVLFDGVAPPGQNTQIVSEIVLTPPANDRNGNAVTDLAAYITTGTSNRSFDGVEDVDGLTVDPTGSNAYEIDIYGNVFDPGLSNDPGDGEEADDVLELLTDDLDFVASTPSTPKVVLGADVRPGTATVEGFDPDDGFFVTVELLSGGFATEFVNLSGLSGVTEVLYSDGSSALIDSLPSTPSPDGIVDGTSAADTINASYADGAGETVGETADTVDSKAGNDTVVTFGGDDTVTAGDGDDVVEGGSGNDELRGQAGDDELTGNGGEDDLRGGSGNDTIFGNTDDDDITGGSGNDTLAGGNGADDFYFDTGDGQDTITDFNINADRLKINGVFVDPNLTDQGYTADWSTANSGSTTVTYGSDSVELLGVNFNEWKSVFTVNGDEGDNLLYGTAFADEISGGAGNDRIYAGDDGDTLWGGEGNDILGGNAGDDDLYGNRDNDDVRGHAGNDFGDGGSGNDWMTGGDGDDWFKGGTGNDTVLGQADNDTVRGGEGNDLVVGGDGVDDVYGDLGQDDLVGGLRVSANNYTADGDADRFIFKSYLDSQAGSGTRDTIHDFETGIDQIDVISLNLSGGFASGATANSIWAVSSGADTRLLADVNGDTTADFEILLKDVSAGTITSEDFIFT